MVEKNERLTAELTGEWEDYLDSLPLDNLALGSLRLKKFANSAVISIGNTTLGITININNTNSFHQKRAQQDIHLAKLEKARKMLVKDFDESFIIDITELSLEDVRAEAAKLKKSTHH